jgi:DNA processing protein
MESKNYWIGFNLVKGIGAVRLQTLLDYFDDLEEAWNAPADALSAAGLPAKIVENFTRLRNSVDLEKYCEQIQKKGISVLTWQDEEYPERLKQIVQPPPVLYILGSIEAADDWSVAVVGTRRITPYGRQVAEDLATFLARNRITVVSGLARGVDAVAHQAVIRSGGRTLAVLGSGVDRIYPPEHRQLAEQITRQGAIISDYPPGTPPESINFPPRNRIISGLSQATVVVEASETSGAMITANFAAEQGREVFAVPGSIISPQSKGANRLIQRGAHPLLQAEDIIDVLNMSLLSEHRTARSVLPADQTEASLLKVLGDEPLHVDEIRSQSGLPIDVVSATLTMMELKGMVRQVGGMNFVAVREAQSEYGVG